MIGGPHQRPGLHVFETVLAFPDPLPPLELRRCHPARHRNVRRGRSQVLAERKDIDRCLAQIPHGVANLGGGLPHSQDDARLRESGLVHPFRRPEERDRSPVPSTGPDLGMQPLDGFEVVPQDRGPGLHHGPQSVFVALEVGDEHLDRAVGQPPSDVSDRFRVDPRSAVGQLVTVHRSDHDVLQGHLRDRVRYPPRLVLVELGRQSVCDPAVLARPGAHVPQDHERGRPGLPALPDVRAARFLTDGMQGRGPHQALKTQIVLPAGRSNLQPLGLSVTQGDRLQSLVRANSSGALGLDHSRIAVPWMVSPLQDRPDSLHVRMPPVGCGRPPRTGPIPIRTRPPPRRVVREKNARSGQREPGVGVPPTTFGPVAGQHDPAKMIAPPEVGWQPIGERLGRRIDLPLSEGNRDRTRIRRLWGAPENAACAPAR